MLHQNTNKMRNNLLQKRAFCAALFVLLLVVVGMKNALAQTQVATLQHGEDISIFYGQNAFVEAHTAAETGDVITLSSGTFTPTDITKAITLRGASCAIDTVSGTYPTIIPNTIQMNVTNDTAFLTVEGIFFSGSARFQTLNHPKFIKCNFENFTIASNNSSMQNAQITNCKFKSFSFYKTSNTTLINCVVWEANSLNSTIVTVTAYNSFIKLYFSSAYALNAYNCIIANYDNGNQVPGLYENSVAYNCIGIKAHYGVFNGGQTFNCMDNKTYSQVFASFNPESNYIFSYDEAFILKEEIATDFLGTDGTEVGVHGGIMPYSIRPSYMVIDHCNVANRSTIDGKLSVEIEVSTQSE